MTAHGRLPCAAWLARQPQAARQVVPGADRNDAELHGGTGEQAVDDLLHRAVTTNRDDAVMSIADRIRGDRLCLTGTPRDLELDVGSLLEPLTKSRDQAPGAAGTRRGVHDDQRGVRHVRDCAVGVKRIDALG